jgi:hypothetical protein
MLRDRDIDFAGAQLVGIIEAAIRGKA